MGHPPHGDGAAQAREIKEESGLAGRRRRGATAGASQPPAVCDVSSALGRAGPPGLQAAKRITWSHGCVTRGADHAHMTRENLHRLLRKHRVQPETFRAAGA